MKPEDKAKVQQALEAMEVASSCVDGYYLPEGKTLLPEVESAITALRQLLEQPEPVQPIGYEKYAAIREGHESLREFVRAIDAKLREKNGGEA